MSSVIKWTEREDGDSEYGWEIHLAHILMNDREILAIADALDSIGYCDLADQIYDKFRAKRRAEIKGGSFDG